MNARVDIKTLRFLKIARVPVVSPDGAEDHLDYPVVNGVMLVPVSDAHRFGVSASTIRRLFNRGELRKYDRTGAIKRGSGSETTFFDPYEYFNNQ